MKIIANREIKYLFYAIVGVVGSFCLLTEIGVWFLSRNLRALILIFILFLLLLLMVLGLCYWYFSRQNRMLENAVDQINAFLDGDIDARIACDEEGEIYRLFHSVNTLAAVLSAQASNENREKEFLKNTISNISHQLKTPLAALNIYNGLMQEEVKCISDIQEFASLSEKELDRMETLVQNLLKITKLDAGSIVFEKRMENVEDLMKDVELHFAYRAKQDRKTLTFTGDDSLILYCDRDWMMEAIDNIVKNALDHIKEGDFVHIEWRQFSSLIQIQIKDNGCGIHPEDLHHIFKRFYRSRFSKDIQGLGLGLPLAKAIIEEHNGTIEVDSALGEGTIFIINFLIPTKL